MNIKSLNNVKWINGKFVIEDPAFIFKSEVSFDEYVIQKGEDMRIDLVMQSIYGDYNTSDADVLLYINGIDNPINIREGVKLIYPPVNLIGSFRYEESISKSSSASAKEIRNQLGKLNKSTRKDENRKKFLDSDYSLPPFVMKDPRPGVTVEGTNIKIGGL